MLIADAAGEEPPRRSAPAERPATPEERAAAARVVAAEEFRGPLICRACALEVVERMVLVSVETAEEALRRRLKEQVEWPN